jgi:putative copper resistance protein D
MMRDLSLATTLTLASLAVLTSMSAGGLLSRPVMAQEMPGHDHMGHMQMDPMAMPEHAAMPAKTPEELAEDKRFSEGNHHLAGVFVLLVGLLAMIEPWISERHRWARYLWSLLFLVPGVYLMIWSDPESWPTGSQTLSYVITQNLEVLQHKLFAVILLGLAVVEFVRVRRNSASVWLAAIFPALAGAGALLLLFHVHGGEMTMETMQKVQKQHIGFAVTGFGIALSKAFADVGRFQPRLMRNLFASLMVVLGLLLLFYAE